MPEVYILHFSRPVWGKVQHYCGYTKLTADERLQRHQSGNGSRLCKCANDRGITYEIVHMEQFDSIGEAMKREIELKKGSLRRHCPCCQSRWSEPNMVNE